MLALAPIRDNALTIATFLYVVAATSLLVVDPTLTVAAAAAPLILYLMVRKSWVRVAVIVVGGMLVLGSSSDVGPAKMAYAGAMFLCVVISTIRLSLNPPTWIRIAVPLFAWAAILLLCLLMGAIATSGQDLMTVVRQGVFYTMIPLAPIVGIDAGREIQSKSAIRWIGVIGFVAAAGFAADWLNRRGVSSLSFGRFVVSSLILSALGFALALVMIIYARRLERVLWTLAAIAIPAALLITGTRTNLVVFFALVGLLGVTAKFGVPMHKALLLLAFLAAAVAVLLPIFAEYVIKTPGFLESRLNALMNVATGSRKDLSLEARTEQYYHVWNWIQESPWFGKGPGFNPPISLDTPLATVVRLGVIGTIAMVGFLGSLLWMVYTTGKKYGRSVMHTATRGIAMVAVVMLPFGSPVEDKGFAFMLVLLIMGVASCVQARVDGLQPFPVPARRITAQGPMPRESGLAALRAISP
ncbi:O-antigen ligase family protein [Pseudarthrobacter quantipunctorum]|uniref:O-antigen ligase family protein n=1 Tax=Pseudarthrobacter quantipunctorum TaxID=3128980 RepID=A0ABZ2R691_9MICC